jgi:hypothetical protein
MALTHARSSLYFTPHSFFSSFSPHGQLRFFRGPEGQLKFIAVRKLPGSGDFKSRTRLGKGRLSAANFEFVAVVVVRSATAVRRWAESRPTYYVDITVTLDRQSLMLFGMNWTVKLRDLALENHMLASVLSLIGLLVSLLAAQVSKDALG